MLSISILNYRMLLNVQLLRKIKCLAKSKGKPITAQTQKNEGAN